MLSQISSQQFSEWMAFFMIEPFGFDVDMYGHGIVASTVANVMQQGRKKRRSFKPDDFVPTITETASKSKGSFFANLKTLLMLNRKK